MQVLGQPTFDVYANPVVSDDGGSVLYDGYVHFTEGSTLTTYVLVDGVPYATRSVMDESANILSRSVHCLPGNTVPSVTSLIAALNDMRVASTARLNGGKIKCASGNLFKMTFQGLDLAVCASGSSGFRAYGSDIDIKVKYLKHHVQIPVPELTAGMTGKCEPVTSATAVTPAAVALLTGQPVHSEARSSDSGASVTLSSTTCKCMSKPRPCLFIHGLGNSNAEDELQDSMTQYWGNLTEHAPCCTEFKYMVWNSMAVGWNDDMQQQTMCDLASSVTKSGSSTEIADTIVVTHSMGGLALAGAIANGKCTLANSSSWVSMSAPMSGSMGSDYAVELCAGEHTVIMKMIGNITSICSMLSATKSLSYEGGEFASAEINEAYEAAQEVYRKHVYAAICSDSYAGLFSRYLPIYWLLGSTLPHKSDENDGMVEFNSCAGGLPAQQFGDHYGMRFYKTELNHADTTFYFGDGLFNTAQMPVKWFECLL
uniref:GPI inositol-deacylase n=1 Tax=Peronospora matthiolae TaxID=2874970 RepID=A0AAV1UDL8_9STRA